MGILQAVLLANALSARHPIEVRLGDCLIIVWFSLELKINSLELDSEVGRLIMISAWYESLALNPCCIDTNLVSLSE